MMDVPGEQTSMNEMSLKGKEKVEEGAGNGRGEATLADQDDDSEAKQPEDRETSADSNAETKPEQIDSDSNASRRRLDDLIMIYKGIIDGPQLRCLQEKRGEVRRILEGWVSNPEGVLPARFIENQEIAHVIAQIDSQWLKQVFCQLWLIEFNPEDASFAYFAKLYVRLPPGLEAEQAEDVEKDNVAQRDEGDPISEVHCGQDRSDGDNNPGSDRSSAEGGHTEKTMKRVTFSLPVGAKEEEHYGSQLLDRAMNPDWVAFGEYVNNLMKKWGVFLRPVKEIYKEYTEGLPATPQGPEPSPHLLEHMVTLSVRRRLLDEEQLVSQNITDTFGYYIDAILERIFDKAAKMDMNLQATVKDDSLSSFTTYSTIQNQNYSEWQEKTTATTRIRKKRGLITIRMFMASLWCKKKKEDVISLKDIDSRLTIPVHSEDSNVTQHDVGVFNADKEQTTQGSGKSIDGHAVKRKKSCGKFFAGLCEKFICCVPVKKGRRGKQGH